MSQLLLYFPSLRYTGWLVKDRKKWESAVPSTLGCAPCILLVKCKNRWKWWWMGSLMKQTSCVGVRQVCTQVSMWLWWSAAVEWIVFFQMNKNVNLKNLKHFDHRCNSYNHKSKNWIFWIKVKIKMNGDLYSWSCFSKLFKKYGSKDQEALGGKKWSWVPETEWCGGKGRKKRKIEGSILINNHLQFLVWWWVKRKEIMRTSITCLT